VFTQALLAHERGMAYSFSARDPAHRASEAGVLVAIEGGNRTAEDPARFAKIVHDNLDFVWRSLRRFGVRQADVDDATQRVFLIANEKLSKIEPGREAPFLIGIAARIASHARRAYQRRGLAELKLSASPRPANPDPEELTQRLQARALLDRALDKMPQELRAVFVLFELEELSVDEVARALALPRGTAATRLRRSREVFHQCARAVALESGVLK
jgi:RNA polymerase sigma-70 factor, ECF subfamily